MTDTKKDQHARFLETARQLGCDEDEAAFDERLKAVVKPGAKGPVSCMGQPSPPKREPNG